MSDEYFSADYQSARRRFLSAVAISGGQIDSYPVANPEADDVPLYVDVASVGSGDKVVVVSSGLHGIEGFFGSAVQLALLDQIQKASGQCRYLFLHALNPFGFHYLRRVDGGNVDLNRNFPTAQYRGAPAGYQRLNGFLNPQTGNSLVELFKLRAAWKIARHGMSSLKESVASGQYEYPNGLFYGGRLPTVTTTLVVENICNWVAGAKQVFHVDLHTGLGKSAECKLLACADEVQLAWFNRVFGEATIESLGKQSATAYPVNGQFGSWLQNQFNAIDYRFIGAEFGTYPVLEVLQALRAEQRQHFYGVPGSESYKAAKQRLQECFCPVDWYWRQSTVAMALSVINSGAKSL